MSILKQDGASATAPAERLACEPLPPPTTPAPTPTPTPLPPPDEPPTPDPAPPRASTRAEAVRFLTQATFGASPVTIDEVMATEYQTWIERQLDLPTSLTEPFVRANSNGSLRSTRHHIWWTNAVMQPDQLRQRLAFAWSELFVVSDIDYELSNAQYAMCGYYDLLAAGSTGTFRDLLEQVALHPVMGIYLSTLRNEKADPARNVRPDENFAREVLQLFTIGLFELQPDGAPLLRDGEPIPTYDQSTIEQFAKVFTGWNFSGTDDWTSGDLTKYDKGTPMVPVERYHDTTSKHLLSGVVVPAGQGARADLDAALDNIVAHPNVGPFIARNLIQRLVTSNPQPDYIARVAAVFDDDGTGVRGNLAAVSSAILLDVAARSAQRAAEPTFGKVKEPMLRLTQLWRAFDAQPGPGADGRLRSASKPMDAVGDIFGQAPLRSPSVFNFFVPDHPVEPGSDLVAPELSILTEIDLASTNNDLFRLTKDSNSALGGTGNVTQIRIDRELAMADDPEQLVEHLDVLLTGSTAPVGFRDALVAHLRTHSLDDAGRIERVSDAIACFVLAPSHLVQK